MSNVAFPRVLVVSGSPLHALNATGITLSQLFLDWPQDHLAEIYLDPWPAEPKSSRAWLVEDSAFPLDGLLRSVSRLRKRTLRARPSTVSNSAAAAGPDRYSRPTHTNLLMRAIPDMGPFRMSNAIKEGIREFRPDVIYSPLGNLRMMSIALAASKVGGCPVVPHFLDDWPQTLYQDSPLVAPARALLHRRLASILRQAPIGLAISPQMTQEYQRRYDLPFAPFMTCAEDKDFRNVDTSEQRRQLRFVYAGGLHLERWLPLAKVAEEVVSFGHEMLVLAPPADAERYRSRFVSSPALRFGHVPFDGLAAELHRADVVVHVESFRPDLAEYTRYSVSTKIPYYMAARKPILAVGPQEQAAVQVVDQADAGTTCCSLDLEPIRAAVKAYDESFELRALHGSNGFRYAQQNFHGPAVRERFRLALMSGADSASCEDCGSAVVTDSHYA